jgi:lipoate-protein ligase A
MLLSTNLARLTELLSSPLEEASNQTGNSPEKRSFGVSSVRSPVCNVSDLSYKDFCAQLSQEFGPEESIVVDEESRCILDSSEPMARIREYMAELRSWEWCFGKSPPAWIRRSGQSLCAFVEDGVVTSVSHPEYSSLLQTRFTPKILS